MRSVIELFKLHRIDTTYIDDRYYLKVDHNQVKYKLRDEQNMVIKSILKKGVRYHLTMNQVQNDGEVKFVIIGF